MAAPIPVYIEAALAESMQRGVSSTETGLKVSNVSHRYENPKQYSQNEVGTRDGFVTNYDPFVVTSMDAEEAGGTDVVFGVAATLNNAPPAAFDITPGSVFLENAEITENRENWKAVRLEFISIEGLEVTP